jgi:N12 class adenine-specific DNA methylase
MPELTSERWEKTVPVPTSAGEAQINEYYAGHSDQMLGQLTLVHGQYRRDEPAVVGALTPGVFERALERIPEAVYQPRNEPDVIAPEVVDWCGVKDFAYAELEGRLVRRVGAAWEEASVSPSVARCIRGMMRIRDAVREVFRTQLEERSEHEILAARQRLNRSYDDFVAWFGPLSSKENTKAFASDPDLPLLLSLENYNPETERATKTAVFDRRTIERQRSVTHVDSAAEALLVSLNETGRICWPRMEEVTDRDRSELEEELGPLVYLNPDGDVHETAEAYLSGNVRSKLAIAEAAARIDPRFQRNVEALRPVVPRDIEPADIEASMGAPWIPETDVRDFVAQLLGAPPDAVCVSHAEAIATWTVTPTYQAKVLVSNVSTFGTARFLCTELVETGLNGRTPTCYDELPDGSHTVNEAETLAARERLRQLKDRFREWIWSDADRAERLAREYNWRYNNIRLRTYDGSHLSLSGMARVHLRCGDLDPHQKNAIWRILQDGTALLWHVVGAGKSWTMAGAAMELRRLGLARKPMFVVPNHLVDQWGAEFLKLYPQANLFIAGKHHFVKEHRKRAMARIATNEFDAVIVSHRSFECIPVSGEFFKTFVNEQLDELEQLRGIAQDNGSDGRMVKELEKAKRRLETRMQKRARREAKDDVLTFEELGIDMLFVDEADLFKNLFFQTRKTRIAGLPNVDSYRAFDMYLKCRYLRERYRGRGVVFATATAISNTIAEMFTLLRYLALELLETQGTDQFDAWAANYAREVTSLELAPDGSGYRMNTRFSLFVNLPELMLLLRSVADIQTADMLNLPRPSLATGKPIGIAAPASPELKAFVQTLIKRAERLRRERIDPREDNMLKITSEGRKAALDMRLIDPQVKPGPDAKVAKAVDHTFRTWKESSSKRSTQLLFVDLSTPNPKRFNVYDDIRAQLIAKGVPEREIAFIHNAKTDHAKKKLYDAVNAGRIRILLGSTEKLGAGTNVQQRLIAVHHLDAPWRPRDIEQRDGRILRQGNNNSEVWIYRYVTEESFDAYIWQALETKARFINQVMCGDISVRTAEDLETAALTYAEIKAIASGNPAVIEKIKVDTEVRRLAQLRAIWERELASVRWWTSDVSSRLQERRSRIASLEADTVRRDTEPDNSFRIVVGSETFEGRESRKDAATALTSAILSASAGRTRCQCGAYRGFAIWTRPNTSSSADNPSVPFSLEGQWTYTAHANPENPIGTLLSIDHVLANIEHHLATTRAELCAAEKDLQDYGAQLGRPFEQEVKFQKLLLRQRQLADDLDLNKSDQQAAVQAAEAVPPIEVE